ncbi:MAG: transcription elongation factor GreA [Patescibacteria group bacterium]
MPKIILTKNGLQNLKKELIELKTVKRREIAERIRRAIEQGDLTENAEYAQAKEEQAFLEGRIAEIENKVKHAEVISEHKTKSNIIELGSTFKVKLNGDELIYTLVGSSEADPEHGRISNESPIGQAFFGKKTGDIVEVQTPNGAVKYKILEIE